MVKIIDLYENVIMTVDIPDGLNGNLLFSIRGLVQISEKKWLHVTPEGHSLRIGQSQRSC